MNFVSSSQSRNNFTIIKLRKKFFLLGGFRHSSPRGYKNNEHTYVLQNIKIYSMQQQYKINSVNNNTFNTHFQFITLILSFSYLFIFLFYKASLFTMFCHSDDSLHFSLSSPCLTKPPLSCPTAISAFLFLSTLSVWPPVHS